MPPRVAVGFASIFNFVGAFLSLKVAATVGQDIVNSGAVTMTVVFAGLIGAIAWNLTTWYLGLPTSSSHALIGGIAGSAIAAAGFGVIQWRGLYEKVLIPSLWAPALAIPAAAGIMYGLLWIIRRRAP